MHLILTGATGLIGTGVLASMLKTKDISKITILSRRPVRFAEDARDPRVSVVIHSDFGNYDDAALQDRLKDASGCVWALGSTSTTTVEQEEYVRATRDYGIAAARAFAKLGSASAEKPFHFVYVSGEGAEHNPGITTTLYAKTKGEAERMLAQVAEETPSLMILAPRPGMVDGTHHKEIKDYLPKSVFLHRVLRGSMTVPIRFVLPKLYATTEMLGNVYTQLAMGKLDQDIEGDGALKLGTRSWAIGNRGVHRLAGRLE